MRILLTNDDGIYAPGLRALRKELLKLGEVSVVAPATEQSATGHSITLLVPLMTQEVLDEDQRFLGWAIEGKPADCVKLALQELLPAPPGLLLERARPHLPGAAPRHRRVGAGRRVHRGHAIAVRPHAPGAAGRDESVALAAGRATRYTGGRPFVNVCGRRSRGTSTIT